MWQTTLAARYMAKSTERLRVFEGDRAYILVQATNLACAEHSIQETCSGSTQPPGTCQVHPLSPSSALCHVSEHFLTLCAAYLAMISGSISRMLEGRALRFLGRPTRPGGKEMVSPCSNTLLALPMVALIPVLASPKPVLATFFTPSYT